MAGYIRALMTGVVYNDASFVGTDPVEGVTLATPNGARPRQLGITLLSESELGNFQFSVYVSTDGTNFQLFDTFNQDDNPLAVKRYENWAFSHVRLEQASKENDVDVIVQYLYA